MRNTILILLLFLQPLLASPEWPQLFAEQSTPLYQALKPFQSLQRFEALTPLVSEYRLETEQTLSLGYKADQTRNQKERIAYLKALRSLQRLHDRIIGLTQRQLLDAMQNNAYDTFLHIVESLPKAYIYQPGLKEQVIEYYRKQRGKGHSMQLNQILREEKGVIKVYAQPATYQSQSVEKADLSVQLRGTAEASAPKSITLVTRPGCPWCAKAIRYFSERHIKFREYSVKSSQGRQLFRHYNGTGVPLILIDGHVIRGYNATAIATALRD